MLALSWKKSRFSGKKRENLVKLTCWSSASTWAKSVLTEFVFNGTHKSRMKSEGFGEKFPVAPNRNANGLDNHDGRAKNRRVEVIVITTEENN